MIGPGGEEALLWFRLAATLGMTVRECQDRVTAREFEGWRAFAILDPWWLGQRIDAASAMVGSLIFNTSRSKRSQTRSPDRFVPDYRKRARQILRGLAPRHAAAAGSTADELQASFRAFTVHQGGKLIPAGVN